MEEKRPTSPTQRSQLTVLDQGFLIACQERAATIAMSLLKRKAVDVNLLNSDGNTPLLVVTKMFDLPMMQILLDAKADTEAVDRDGNSALLIACKENKTDMIKLLLERKANPNFVNRDGEFCLSLLASCKDDGAVSSNIKLLIDHKADVNKQGKRGETPVMQAFSLSCSISPAVQALVAGGADINIPNEEGRTCLILACSEACYNKKRPVPYFLDLKANLDIVDKSHQSALLQLAMQLDCNILKMLLDRGANIDISDKEGCTALMLVAKSHCCKARNETFRFLLERGANIHAQDNEGQTALTMLSNEVVRVQSGLSLVLSVKDTIREHYGLCQMLAEAGADIFHTDKSGKCAFGQASEPHKKSLIGWYEKGLQHLQRERGMLLKLLEERLELASMDKNSLIIMVQYVWGGP